MIHVEHLSKIFRIPHERRNTAVHTVMSLVKGNLDYEELYALRDVSFDIRQGEFVGIVGRNGSGKSTLLKILSRIYIPTSGTADVSGEVYPLLELGIGFQAEFSVRENLYIYGSFLGFSRKEMDLRLHAILEFSELSRFIDAKLDNLSSGMKVRLAFAIAMQAHASVYLVDEVMAVGDRWFQEKCRKEFWKLRAEKKTVLFVSHDQGSIKEFCDRVIVFAEGQIVNQGSPAAMIDFYNSRQGAAA
jgi:ABC-type polysaccharide/polyol phosphate transport system ATPase subunit